MPVQLIFPVQLVLGYVAGLLVFNTYLRPRFRGMDDFGFQRVIATIHGFRFFGLGFLVPGVVGLGLPAGFAVFAAYADFATGVLAILALVSVKVRPLFWTLVVAFNLVGTADLLTDYYHAVRLGLPNVAGQLGVMTLIVLIYVPLLMITHVYAFYRLLHGGKEAAELAGSAA